MAARRMMLPDYGTVSMKGTQYYRTRVTDQQGRRVSLYARTREELYQKGQIWGLSERLQLRGLDMLEVLGPWSTHAV